MSEPNLRRLSELALIGIASVCAAEPAFAGLFGWLLNDERLSAIGWLGAAPIMAAIVAVEIIPRFRPPRPLPEG